MIEKKFSNEPLKLFGHDVFTSDCEEWVVAIPKLFNNSTEVVNLYEHFEEKGYNFLFSSGNVLYFRRKK